MNNGTESTDRIHPPAYVPIWPGSFLIPSWLLAFVVTHWRSLRIAFVCCLWIAAGYVVTTTVDNNPNDEPHRILGRLAVDRLAQIVDRKGVHLVKPHSCSKRASFGVRTDFAAGRLLHQQCNQLATHNPESHTLCRGDGGPCKAVRGRDRTRQD